jgi:hypothetical protein
MVSDVLYELIGLRDRLTPLNRKIDKKMFFEQMDFSSKEKQQFTQWIDRIVMSYLLASQNINIHSYADEEKKYENVSFLTVSLKKELSLKQVHHLADLLQESLPNPTILCFTSEENVLLCTALKRINKNNSKKAIVEEIRLSSWLNIKDMHETTERFIKSIHLSSLSFTSFYDLYSGLHYALELLEVADKTGRFVLYEEEELKELTALVEQVTSLESEIEYYRKLIKKESQFNKKVEYNLKIRTLKKLCDILKMNMNS